MTLKLGQTDDETRKEESSGYERVGRFSEEGEYHHRPLVGPKRRETIVYPTYWEDLETGELKLGFNSVIVTPKVRNIVDKIAAIDRKVQEQNGIDRKSIRSSLDRTLRYIWIVLSRDITSEEGNTWIGPWEYPSRISKELTKLQREVSTKDNTKLRYGLYWTCDFIIERYIDKEVARKTGNKQFATRYSITVDPECMPMAGKLPKKLLDDKEYIAANQKKIEKLYTEVFTPEELNAIEEYMANHDIQDFITPVETDEELLEVFTQRPINWDAKNNDGTPLFPYKDDLLEEINKYEGNLLANIVQETPQLPDKSEDKPAEEKEAETIIESVIEEQEEEEVAVEGTTISEDEEW